MKILFLTRYFYPHIGGVEKHVIEIGTRLVAKGHQVTVITEKPLISSSNHKQLTLSSATSTGIVNGINVIRINPGSSNWFKKFYIWKEILKHSRLIKESDIIHTHDVFFWYLPFRFLYPTKKVFVTFHGYEGNNIPKFKAKFMHKLAEKLSFGNISIGDFYKKWYNTEATFISFGAVSEALISKKVSPKENNNRFAFIGRLEAETGILEYLEAINLVNKSIRNITLDVYGEGSLIVQAKQYVKKNKLNVKFHGFISKVEDVIMNYDYLFVSRYLGILEGLAARKYIFAIYNNAIKKDYLQNTPFAKFISISGNSKELAKEIERVNNSEKIKKVEMGYEWVKDKTWDNLTNSYLTLWSKR